MLRFFIFLLSLAPFVSMEGTESCKGTECPPKTWHKVGCSTDDDCDQPYTTCYKRACRCHPGYYYTTHDTCTDTCSPGELQDSFTEYPDSALRENLIGSWDGLTVEACKDRCQTNKTCITFDFKADGSLCRHHRATAHDSPSDWAPKTSKGWTHYQKSCKSTFASHDNWYNLLCNSKIDCRHPHSDCLSGRCLCHSGFHFDQAEKKCVATRTCADLLATGAKTGVYIVQLEYSNRSVSVWCDMDTAGGGWLVIQRRGNNQHEFVDFNRNYTEYANGFGNISEDFWLGLDAIGALSRYGTYTRLRVELETYSRRHIWAEYSSFFIVGPNHNYELNVWGYSGDAGDGLTSSDGYVFQTYDRNYSGCVSVTKGAWWYSHGCNARANLNSPEKTDMTWSDYKDYLNFSEMKIKPQ